MSVNLPQLRWPWAESDGEGGVEPRELVAIARRLPELLGPLLDLGVQPLSLAGGELLAAVIDEVPGAELAPWLARLRHVQTSSPSVCRALGPQAPSFHVEGWACVAALAEAAGAFTRVSLRGTGTDDAPRSSWPFEVSLDDGRAAQPEWWQAPRLEQGFLPLASLGGADLSLCWDRDERRPVAVHGSDDVRYGLLEELAGEPAAPTGVVEVSARELGDHPERYHRRRMRFRDLVRNQLESMSAGGAWWSPEGEALPSGTHLAEVEGLWLCDPSQRRGDAGGYGHFGQWRAELRGQATPVSWDRPRRGAVERVAEARELVPLEGGPRRVRVVGEVWHEYLWAHSLELA